MDTKRLVTGTVVGAVVLFAVGYLFWGVLFVDFFASQQPEGLMREAPIWWAGAVGALAFALLLTLAIDWTEGASAMDGLKTGALVGLLVWLSVDLILYANFNFASITGAFADIGLETVHNALAGAAIAAVIARGGAGESATA